AMDQHRSRGRRAGPTDDALVLEAFGGTAPGPDAGVVDSALWVRVARLPERQREAVVLKYVADLDHPRIAEMLGTTPTMSRRLVSDGLKTLRKDL
ncbi:sigma factor-like helix-turn-helix DNA-binding protein, partial [Lapillicoccus sp.]|uniref:RNA polymerase sigma factor n=1 Tax=Lapillicoccus sp. TaxID=1909287 RepID=UPI003263453E